MTITMSFASMPDFVGGGIIWYTLHHGAVQKLIAFSGALAHPIVFAPADEVNPSQFAAKFPTMTGQLQVDAIEGD